MAARTKGKARVTWKKPTYEISEEEAIATILGTGLYDEIVSSRPRVGASHAKVKGNFKITRIFIEPGRSTDGKITVTLRAGGDGDSPDVPELDWGTESRPVEQHRKCPRLAPSRPYYAFPDRAFNADNNPRYNSPADAEEETPVAQRTFENWSCLDAQDMAGGDWSLAQYKSLKEAGRNDYQVVFPIARILTYSATRPGSIGTGLLDQDSPPGSTGAPGGQWVYFKSADRAIKEGDRWSRRQEWEGRSGAEAQLDGLLY